MLIHPLMMVMLVIVTGLFGAAITFIWTSDGISRTGKAEHTVLALVYAVSLLIFADGMLDAQASLWALPVAVMLMGFGTAWANWRAGVKFWLIFGLMALLGGTSLLITQIWMPEHSSIVYLLLNAPWMILTIWLIGLLIRRAESRFKSRKD